MPDASCGREDFSDGSELCSGTGLPFRGNLAPSLIRYLKQSHEYFLDFNLPSIRRKLIEAVDCSGGNDIAMLIIRFYDEYVQAVRKHMEYENDVVFSYVEQLSQGI